MSLNPAPRVKPNALRGTSQLADARYRIAAASGLTGIPAATIRGWEHRYGVVQPARSEGNIRLYSKADIERLALLKSAVDAGHAIGTVATLDNEQLRRRLDDHGGRRSPAVAGRVLVCGEGLHARLKAAWSSSVDLQVTALVMSLDDADFTTLEPVEVAIVDAPSLRFASVSSLNRLRRATKARVVIVIYGFSSRQTLSQLDQAGIIALTTPCDPAQIARICRLGLSVGATPSTPTAKMVVQPARPRRYDEARLAVLSQMETSIQCGCPNHLSDLLSRINAFEKYSLDCEITDTADVAIHIYLYGVATHCREMLEDALERVLEALLVQRSPLRRTKPKPTGV